LISFRCSIDHGRHTSLIGAVAASSTLTSPSIASPQRTRERTHSGDDLLGRLIREKDAETGRSLSAEEIQRQIITVVGAGHQSVALALPGYGLSQHPLQEAVLHAELDRVLAGRVPALDDLARLPSTRMVLEEALRLYPPFPTMAWRGTLADDEVCGVKIPKVPRSPSLHGCFTGTKKCGTIPNNSISSDSPPIAVRDDRAPPTYRLAPAHVFASARPSL